MKNTQYPLYFLGEIVFGDNQKPTIVDLLSGNHYLITSNETSINLVSGHIVQFTLHQGVPDSLSLLASSNSVSAYLYKIIAAKQLNPFFSPAIQAEVAKILENPGVDDPELINLDHLPFCTIDGIDTRDLDQALQIEKQEMGYKVRYAIADATYYIKPGTALFEEAMQRGASFYLPGLMIPMLPQELCLDVISLNEGVARRAIVFEMMLDSTGKQLSTKIIRARIRSRGKLSFKEVQKLLDNRIVLVNNHLALTESLRLFFEIGQLRLKLSEERNIVRYRRTELNVKLGSDGMVFNLLDNVRNQVELYNEQLSLLCNISGAKLLAENDQYQAECSQPIYKIHPAPREEKIVALESVINQLIKIHRLDTELWQWHRNKSQTLFEYLKKLPVVGVYRRVTKAIHRQALMSNTRSLFSEKPGRHHGVGADVYARFSAPMREIVGVFLHKELMEKTMGVATECSVDQENTLREKIIYASNQAKNIQRQLTNEANLLVLDQIFSADYDLPKIERPIRLGTVIGIGRDKLYVVLDQIGVEVKLYIPPLEKLLKKRLMIDHELLSLIDKNTKEVIISLGNEVKLIVEEKDVIKSRWVFTISKMVRNNVRVANF